MKENFYATIVFILIMFFGFIYIGKYQGVEIAKEIVDQEILGKCILSEQGFSFTHNGKNTILNAV